MRKSASGAQVVRELPEPRGSGKNRKLPIAQPLPAAGPRATKPRWSGSLHKLADRKRTAKDARPPLAGATAVKAAGAQAAAPPGPTVAMLQLPANPCPARSRLLVSYRRWNCDRRWQVPCWLTSLVLHLLAVVVLGSIAVPVSNQRTVVSILLSFGELDAQSDEGPVELATTMNVAAAETQAVAPQADRETDRLFESQPQIQTASLISNLFNHVPPRDQAEPRSQQTINQGGAQLGASAPAQSSVAEGGSTETRVIDTANKAHDNVVEQFIEFDIGRLQGAEGAKARHDFERLGPEAIASLVRGLNKSASIHASCPVMVISNKLEGMLRENRDPALLRYALANIGRGVPAKAPHLGRLHGLVYQLRQLHPSETVTNVSMILASLKSRDQQHLIQAANAVAADCGKLLEFERREVAWPLIGLLTHRGAAVRAAAHEALVALAEGHDCGPDDDRRPDDGLAAAGKWSQHFDSERYETAADSVLKTAQHLLDAGKPEAARRYYARLVREYPGTAAAEEAAEELEKPKVLAFK